MNPSRLKAEDLLLAPDPTGQVSRALTVQEWQLRRAEILAGMQKVMGPLPGTAKRVSPDVQVLMEEDRGSYYRRLITYFERLPPDSVLRLIQ